MHNFRYTTKKGALFKNFGPSNLIRSYFLLGPKHASTKITRIGLQHKPNSSYLDQFSYQELKQSPENLS
jgi:hypothetical protein